MILSTAVAAGTAWLLGAGSVALLWPRGWPLRRDAPLILSLGVGVGLGLTSVLFFAASLISSTPLRVTAAMELLAAAALACGLWRRRQCAGSSGAASGQAPSRSAFSLLLATLFAQACVAALVVAARAYQHEPYSNSDGWAIWLMHARIMFRGGDGWAELLRAGQIGWTHPDYPLLVPASIARAWAYVGTDAAAASGAISAMFGASTVAVLVAAVARLRTPGVACVGGLLLVGTPFFVTFSSNQHADIPLGLYILSTIVLMVLAHDEPRAWRLPLLAGMSAGFAAWTKNEGLLFVVVAGVVWIGAQIGRRSPRAIGVFVIGLTVALAPVVHFKLLAPSNDLVESAPWARLAHVFDARRHPLILTSLWRDVWRFGEWGLAPFALMLLPLLGPRRGRIARFEWLVAAVIGLMLLGYYAVYLVTPWDLRAHLDSSLVRLLLQLWPAALLFWCLAVAYRPANNSAPIGAQLIALVLGLNLALAVVVLATLGRQPARNQLAATSLDGHAAKVLLDAGWFGRETHGRDRWAWSRGTSTLRLVWDGDHPRAATLRFDVRALGPRHVAAQVGDRVLWRGAVGEEIASVEIRDVPLQPGTTLLVFKTDAPGVPEAPDPGARALTFAIYNPTIAP